MTVSWPCDGTVLLAAVFDLDGLLVDSESLQMEAWRKVLQPFGAEVVPDGWAKYMGRRVIDTARDLVEKLRLPLEPMTLVQIRERYLLDLVGTMAESMPGAAEAVLWFRAQGLKVALATSGYGAYVDLCLRRIGLHGAFDVVITGDMVRHGKPDPEIYLATLHALGVPGPRAVALEDSPAGAKAAKGANMKVVVVPNGYTRHSSFEADAIVDTLNDAIFWLSSGGGSYGPG